MPEPQKQERDSRYSQHEAPHLNLELDLDMTRAEIITQEMAVRNQIRCIEPFRAAPRCQR